MNHDAERLQNACDGAPLSLAECGVGRVVACSCGNVHVDIEYVTLRFAPDAFMELAEMLSQAQRRLAGRHANPAVVADVTAMH